MKSLKAYDSGSENASAPGQKSPQSSVWFFSLSGYQSTPQFLLRSTPEFSSPHMSRFGFIFFLLLRIFFSDSQCSSTKDAPSTLTVGTKKNFWSLSIYWYLGCLWIYPLWIIFKHSKRGTCIDKSSLACVAPVRRIALPSDPLASTLIFSYLFDFFGDFYYFESSLSEFYSIKA